MAERNMDTGAARASIRAGRRPGVRRYETPDFSKQAAEMEKAEEERREAAAEAEGTEETSEMSAEELEAAAQAGAEPEEEEFDKSKPHWYVVHTYSGYENKVKTSIEKTVISRGMEDRILEVRVPVEEVTEIRNSQNKTVQRKLFPGYVFVYMINDENTWFVVRNTRGVTGFVGPGSDPVPLTKEEMRAFNIGTEPVTVDFEVGDLVRIMTSSMGNSLAKVLKIDLKKQEVEVMTELFASEIKMTLRIQDVRKEDK